MNAYELGRDAGRRRIAWALNPFPENSRDHDEWRRGWIRGTGELMRHALGLRRGSALVLPHPAMTAGQCELLCRREGLALAHLGHDRLVLVQTSARPQTMLRIAPTPFDFDPEPEAS